MIDSMVERAREHTKGKIKLLSNLKNYVNNQIKSCSSLSSDLARENARGCNEVIKKICDKIDSIIISIEEGE